MRKRNKSKKKLNPDAKSNKDIGQVLDKLFTNVGLIRRDWYTKNVHENTMKTLVETHKLQAIKYLMEISREKDGDDGRYGLKNLKDFLDQFDSDLNVKQRRIDLGLENSQSFNTNQMGTIGAINDREILTDVIHSISDDIKYKNSTNGLRNLMSYVPLKVLKEYWIGIK